ncbi:MAG: hypothetical protein ACRETL_10900, partial [Gammaproteobacteria bacterium]
ALVWVLLVDGNLSASSAETAPAGSPPAPSAPAAASQPSAPAPAKQAASVELPASAVRPVLKANDTWTFRATIENKSGWHQTREEQTVVRSSDVGILLSTREAGSNATPRELLVGPDWTRVRSVNGKQTVVARPLVFPMATGLTWRHEFTELSPNREHTKETWQTVYKVVGPAEVTVPAGTFKAFLIEGDGTWNAELSPALASSAGSRVDAQGSTVVLQTTKIGSQVASGRVYKAYWYVQAVKKYVKSVEEFYGSNGTRNERFTWELESYKVAN